MLRDLEGVAKLQMGSTQKFKSARPLHHVSLTCRVPCPLFFVNRLVISFFLLVGGTLDGLDRHIPHIFAFRVGITRSNRFFSCSSMCNKRTSPHVLGLHGGDPG